MTPRPVWPLPEGGPGRRSPCSGGICAWWSCCFREILEAVFGREDPRAPQWAPSLRGLEGAANQGPLVPGGRGPAEAAERAGSAGLCPHPAVRVTPPPRRPH